MQLRIDWWLPQNLMHMEPNHQKNKTYTINFFCIWPYRAVVGAAYKRKQHQNVHSLNGIPYEIGRWSFRPITGRPVDDLNKIGSDWKNDKGNHPLAVRNGQMYAKISVDGHLNCEELVCGQILIGSYC